MTFAYAALIASTAELTAPADWPAGWNYTTAVTNDGPWPPGWDLSRAVPAVAPANQIALWLGNAGVTPQLDSWGLLDLVPLSNFLAGNVITDPMGLTNYAWYFQGPGGGSGAQLAPEDSSSWDISGDWSISFWAGPITAGSGVGIFIDYTVSDGQAKGFDVSWSAAGRTISFTARNAAGALQGIGKSLTTRSFFTASYNSSTYELSVRVNDEDAESITVTGGILAVSDFTIGTPDGSGATQALTVWQTAVSGSLMTDLQHEYLYNDGDGRILS